MKVFDVPLVMFGYVWRSLHVMSYAKDDVLYQDEFIVYHMSPNKNKRYTAWKVSVLGVFLVRIFRIRTE